MPARTVLARGLAGAFLVVCLSVAGIGVAHVAAKREAARRLASGGRPLPPFRLTGANAIVTNQSLMGRRFALLLHSTVCPHCQREVIAAHRVASEFGAGLVLLFAQVDDFGAPPAEDASAFRGGSGLLRALDLHSVPALVLVDERGWIVSVHTGELDESAQRLLFRRFTGAPASETAARAFRGAGGAWQ